MWYFGMGSSSLMLRRNLQTGVKTHANRGRPRITPYGKGPDKLFESESLISVLRNPREWRWCQKSHLSVWFHPTRVFSQTLLAWCHACYGLLKTSKQTKTYKYSSWLLTLVSANFSQLACLVGAVENQFHDVCWKTWNATSLQDKYVPINLHQTAVRAETAC